MRSIEQRLPPVVNLVVRGSRVDGIKNSLLSIGLVLLIAISLCSFVSADTVTFGGQYSGDEFGGQLIFSLGGDGNGQGTGQVPGGPWGGRCAVGEPCNMDFHLHSLVTGAPGWIQVLGNTYDNVVLDLQFTAIADIPSDPITSDLLRFGFSGTFVGTMGFSHGYDGPTELSLPVEGGGGGMLRRLPNWDEENSVLCNTSNLRFSGDVVAEPTSITLVGGGLAVLFGALKTKCSEAIE